MPTAELRASLFAHPAAHSLSPALHRAALKAVGWKGGYRAEDVLPAELPARVQALRARAASAEVLTGANLSLPHKVTVMPLLDGLTPAAAAVGAVNTLFWQGGQLMGDNTDAPGLRAALLDAGYSPAPGLRAVLLGAGGAARAALWVLREWGIPTLMLNRTPERAQALAAEWAVEGWDVQAAQPGGVNWAEVGLILNASSAGLDRPDETPLDLTPAQWRELPGSALVYDMVYRPEQTRLRRDAAAQGVRTEGGLGMLAHQAALAFERWTGQQVDAGVLLTVARRELSGAGDQA
ncbi:shikimate dehydrogenase (NADP(+)) [Deinococcus piscis]|uniref:Shikimate dehydrogenase (NADP(+)) n=1 Tax=Deinococcus piscis TaxID=394230 RepID=A0ABQ3K0E1_9DEIO|nr:shikimate dehydrogenase [Deinococcus piscis]GHF97708.1 shikimate dehydrogenase (NADP(+)) [Deinococcus piscis]